LLLYYLIAQKKKEPGEIWIFDLPGSLRTNWKLRLLDQVITVQHMAMNNHKPNVYDKNNKHLHWTRANSNMPHFRVQANLSHVSKNPRQLFIKISYVASQGSHCANNDCVMTSL
jgi:hypothetical protein